MLKLYGVDGNTSRCVSAPVTVIEIWWARFLDSGEVPLSGPPMESNDWSGLGHASNTRCGISALDALQTTPES